jgi:hypothetical protein
MVEFSEGFIAVCENDVGREKKTSSIPWERPGTATTPRRSSSLDLRSYGILSMPLTVN